jgi:adenylate kinase
MGNSPPQVILLGPPGAGKGLQAGRLAERLGVPHIDPGQILREAARSDSPTAQQIRSVMSAGELVPDELVDQLVRERLESLSPEQGFVLDGYPRTPQEARALRTTLARLDRLRSPPIVTVLEVPREELTRRLRQRRREQSRADDADEAIARRLEIHERQARPLEEELASWAELVRIDGGQPPDAVTAEIMRHLCPGQAEAPARAEAACSPGPPAMPTSGPVRAVAP